MYSFKDLDLRNEFGAIYAAQDQAVLFGDVEGCIPVWDKKKAVVVYGLDHGEGSWERLFFWLSCKLTVL